ncbi:hypothetical protein D3C78_1496420 [compost metagenome]
MNPSSKGDKLRIFQIGLQRVILPFKAKIRSGKRLADCGYLPYAEQLPQSRVGGGCAFKDNMSAFLRIFANDRNKRIG